ncbi:OmpW family protein [Acinetobacter sp. S40]|uniref:OmpW/AlkL family protein n=1 Tax=unclassified Acinetobacter TaxID=196816 RepID=UPI00190E2746|nr:MULTISPECIES: OmpW family protein [unclassified Acinetobacter]MBJ9984649.1 OmpW family protein [Acinetobacter sp. S40]MBK0062365.1 OmpW family protein [Acinetobacter sp. S55]MBK0066169.1 OmpW family protein [Acinetobacter sp. S54]
MKKSLLGIATSLIVLPSLSYADSPYFSFKDGDGFKRFSASIGWLHAMPQGKANPVDINTSIAEGTTAKVGDVSKDAVLDAAVKDSNPLLYGALQLLPLETLPGGLSGTATVNGLSNWQAAGTGLEADDVDTVGMMFNYNFTDNVSLEIKAGIPPKVDIKGKGDIYAPLSGSADTPLGSLDLKKDIHITDLTQGDKAASVRAWLPAAELHYQFGKTGVNKFRPYVGLGVMYAYFDNVKLNSGIESDLVKAGHMIQNIHDGQAGAALDGKTSSADPRVKVKATDTFAPIATVGATYDFNENWFAVGSVSYSKMNNEAKITVTDNNTGKELINAKTKIDIDPVITYLGVGYRF